ncbi:NDR1/HIN1-like protein 2 [Henckelia pumila]|uniref:NDR1/HIN1-like protein 2 n=1 Tax=Henckelia pumila TaxID=405737 RepID=UPI003C6E0018
MGVDFIPMGGRNVHGSKYQSSSSAAASSYPDSYYINHPAPSPNHRRLQLLWESLISLGILAGTGLLICGGIFGFRYFDKWMDSRERLPLFWVDSVSISNFSFTNGSSSPRVLIDSQVQFTARNPNLLCSLRYEHIVTSIYYKNELLFQSGLPPFSQGTKNNETYLVAEFTGEGNVVDRWVLDEIDREFGKKGSIGFNFWFSSSIGLCNRTSTDHTLEVLCKDLVVGFPSYDGGPGRLIRQPKNCLVGEESYVR